jgi:hypothetical protein
MKGKTKKERTSKKTALPEKRNAALMRALYRKPEIYKVRIKFPKEPSFEIVLRARSHDAAGRAATSEYKREHGIWPNKESDGRDPTITIYCGDAMVMKDPLMRRFLFTEVQMRDEGLPAKEIETFALAKLGRKKK